MAISSNLWEELVKAKSQPSRAYRTATAALDIPNQALQGYVSGSETADKMQEIGQKNQTLSDMLGPNTPSWAEPYKQLRYRQFKPLAELATGVGAIEKAGETKPSEYVTQDQATKALTGINGKVTPEDAAYLQSFPPNKIPTTDFSRYVTAKTSKETAGARSEFFGKKAGQISLQELPSLLGPNTAPGAAYMVKVAARQGKSLIAKATSPQNLSLAGADLARAVQRSAPYSSTIGESDYGNTLLTTFGRLKQKLDSDPSSPDVPKLRKQLYDTFDELDKASTPWIQNHLASYEENMGPISPAERARQLGTNIPEIPFEESSPVGGIPQQGMIRVKASDGSVHDIPQQNFGKAKQIDPGLTVAQ